MLNPNRFIATFPLLEYLPDSLCTCDTVTLIPVSAGLSELTIQLHIQSNMFAEKELCGGVTAYVSKKSVRKCAEPQ